MRALDLVCHIRSIALHVESLFRITRTYSVNYPLVRRSKDYLLLLITRDGKLFFKRTTFLLLRLSIVTFLLASGVIEECSLSSQLATSTDYYTNK